MKLFFFPIFLLVPVVTTATQQIPDILIVDNVEYELGNTRILDALYSEDSIVSKIKPRELCSANWRGYQATWAVTGKMLYLQDMKKDICGDNAQLIPASVLFANKNYSIKAIWFSGNVPVFIKEISRKEEITEDGITIIKDYQYEQIVFTFQDGVLIKKQTEVCRNPEKILNPSICERKKGSE